LGKATLASLTAKTARHMKASSVTAYTPAT
jgi:hypothetical protein